MKSLRKRFVNIIFASKGSVGRAARLSGHCHCRSSWRAVCRPLWSLQVCFVSIHFVYMFNLWSLSQLFQLDHLAPLQAVHGRVQPWHTNLPCETGPGGSGLSFVLDQEFLQLKARSQSQHDFNWVQNVATQHFSQVTNLNVLLPEAFTPRVRMIIFHFTLFSKGTNVTHLQRMDLKFHSNGTNRTNGTNGTNGTVWENASIKYDL